MSMGAAIMQWARLRAEYDVPLRRGAWYPVLSVSQFEVVVDVNHRAVLVARPYVDVSSSPPSRWTVIDRGAVAHVPPEWATRYAVCPGCRERVPVAEHPRFLRCRRCKRESPVE